jgi:bifunctional non-homologous end joining protein LigD
VGYYDDGHLRYAGRVGSGFSADELTRWQADLDVIAIDQSPFEPPPPWPVTRIAHFVEPRLVIQVAFQEWTRDGHLRAPSYIADRLDKDPRDVVREPTL